MGKLTKGGNVDFVEKFLIDNKVYPSTIGFNYFVEAVHFVEKGETNMTEIYKKIAKKYNTNPIKVERDVRTVKNRIGGKVISNFMGNKEVIFTLARYKTLEVLN